VRSDPHRGCFLIQEGFYLVDSCGVTVQLDEISVELNLWDTISGDQYAGLRPLAYPGSHIIVLNFAINDPISLENVFDKVLSSSSMN
jgi:GTPase SAR1 family protein